MMASSSSSISISSILKAGNTAVITGASSGIGRAAALYFALKGMHVWMVDNYAEELKDATALGQKRCIIGSRSSNSNSNSNSSNSNNKKHFQTIKGRVVDVSDEQAMTDLADEVFDKGGKCHFLFNNAGVQPSAKGVPLTNSDMSTMKFTVNTNLYGPIHRCQAFLPKMKKWEKTALS